MLFWISLALVGIILIISIRISIHEDDWFNFAIGALLSLLVGIAYLVLMVAGTLIWPPTMQETSSKTEQLAAIGASTTVSGRSYYLGSGTIDGQSALNFITKNNNSYQVLIAYGANSVISQTANSPEEASVVTRSYESVNKALFPWRFGTATTWQFTVPEGSINSEYAIGVTSK